MRLSPTRFLLALAVAAAAGIWLGGHPDRLPDRLRGVFVDERAALGTEVIDTVRDSYYREVGRRRLEDASVRGIVRALGDRFSHYFDPATFRRFRESVERRYSGVGLSVNEVKRGLRVASVFGATPAERAGMRRGDLIVAVNGRSIAGLSSEAATARIKGPAGSEVRLTVLRPSTSRRRELRLERARVSVPGARGRLRRVGGRRLGYARLAAFGEGAHGELRRVVEGLRRRGAEGLVLDLRGNGGGLLEEAVLVSSIFIEDGPIVATAGRRRPRRVFRAVGRALPRRPLVVLIDGDTASAAEIVAAALGERGAATLVGSRTFGKGTFQEVVDLPNGGGLNLTVGEYRTPRGKRLNHRGLEPRIGAADRRGTRRDEALARAFEVLGQAVERRR